MEWDGSIKTLPEHETDASREGELGVPGKSYHQFCLLMGKGSFTKHQMVHSWGYGREHFGRQTANTA